MNRAILIKHVMRLALGLAALALAATPSFAQTPVDLCATTGSVTMPDLTEVPIWGFVEGDCSVTGNATLPGYEIRATEGDVLDITLHNSLSVPVSFFVPGYNLGSSGDPSTLAPEALPGGSATYQLAARAGTYLYHSGSDINVQVPMGLYGALVVDFASGEAYDGVTYDQDEVLVYSQIDPNLNDGTNADARVVSWNPQYFLINGEAQSAAPDINVNNGETILLRFVNAGLETFFPTLDGGLYMDLVAEYGNRYPQPFTQYGIELAAGKTIDALITAGADSTYALYDRGASYDDGVVNVVAGAAADAPIATNDAYSLDEDETLTADGLAPNPVGVLDNDTPGTGGGAMTASLMSDVSSGALTLNGDGSFTYTPNADFNGVDTFTYVANDGGPDSNLAMVTITVDPVNDPPVAAPDAYDVTEGDTLIVAAPGVLANDSDVDGDALIVDTTPVVPPTNGTLTLNIDGSFEYLPTVTGLTEPDTDSFTYEICDAELCATAEVTITILPLNSAPTAVDDAYEATEGRTLSVAAPGVLGNDSDINDDALTAAAVGSPPAGLTLNSDGSFDYTPAGAAGEIENFDYEACDTEPLCTTATVTITVVAAGDNAPPVAIDDYESTPKNTAIIFSVTANDIDANGNEDIDVSSVVITSGPTTQRGGTAVANGDGTVTYTPKKGFRGTDLFRYTVKDQAGATSNEATVRIEVTK